MISVNQRIGAGMVVVALTLAACGSDKKSTPTTTAGAATTAGGSSTTAGATTTAGSTATTAAPGTTAASDGVTAAGISPERCAENKAAGTITYVSSFDFSASAS